MVNPFGDTAQRNALREEAERRTAAMHGGGSSNNVHNRHPSPISDLGSSGVGSSDQSAFPIAPHPLEGLSSPDLARKEWKKHGQGLTQTLENKRLQQEQHLLDGRQKPGTFVVRVLSAEKRVDLSGAKYTAYVIRVQCSNPNAENNVATNLVEHRYSEFDKVNSLVNSHNVALDENASFPSKHWAGRVGNWTPSLTWAPEKHNELVNYRVIQLDCWLVHVVNLYNQGRLPLEVAQALYKFLVAPSKPPCENDNDSEAKWYQWNNPVSFTLGSGIRQATRTVQYMCQDPYKINRSDQSIPLDLLHAAKGLCFLTVAKAGLVVSGRIGTGVLVARVDDNTNTSNQDVIRWSAPCAIGTLGMGWGALFGADVTHYLVVLTTTKAVQDLCNSTSVQLGGEMSIAVGPVGRGANSHLTTGDWTLHPAYAYAHSQGLFFGMSLEGSVVSVRSDVNAKFYGGNVLAKEILNMTGPKAAEPLYRVLNAAMQVRVPEDGFRPSTLWTQGPHGYQNHPDRPIYTNQQNQLPMPPPIVPSINQGTSNYGGNSCVVTPSQQPCGSGSGETPQQQFHPRQSYYSTGYGDMPQYQLQHPYQRPYGGTSSQYDSSRPVTVDNMSPVPQALFDANSPSSTIGDNS